MSVHLQLYSEYFCQLISFNLVHASSLHPVRLIVAYIFAACFSHLGRTLQRRYGIATAVFFTIFSLAQFHIPYYASRTLPNFLALPPVAYAVSQLLRGKYWAGIVILTAVATVIRLEVALLVLPTALVLVLTGRMSLGSALGAGIAGGIGSLGEYDRTLTLLTWQPTLRRWTFCSGLPPFRTRRCPTLHR